MTDATLDRLRALLCRLQDSVRDALVVARTTESSETLAGVAAITAADTIYRIDKVGEEVILAWMDRHWPTDCPVELVMEGIEGGDAHTFPRGTPAANARFVCIIDPIDGTRNLMIDKRSAWMLTALAPRREGGTRLRDIVVAAMTELPTTKQWASDQVSGVRGCGPVGLVAERVDVRTGHRSPIAVRPSRAEDFRHGFASLVRFFPEAKAIMARVEESIWQELYGLDAGGSPVVFDDQYMTTGGQIYELMVGHDRMLGDLRPLAHRALGYASALVCHPYDICTSMLLEEAGGIVESPTGEPLDAPLDTTSPVAWVGYANPVLAGLVRPLLRRAIREHLG
jgi:fructose-1,6-bisphosphatase/inositol monophosphatase family enzyme